jgi:hypothetical protein
MKIIPYTNGQDRFKHSRANATYGMRGTEKLWNCRRNPGGLAGALAGVVLLVLVVMCGGCSDSPKTHLVARTQNIANGQIQVDAGKIVYYKVEVTPDMQDAVVNGSFGASGGSGNDIKTVFTDQDDYINWANGHEAQVLRSTKGQQTVGNFSVDVKPGVYYLGLSNKFSVISDKQGRLKVELDYNQQETEK